jgi:hypothetical protein
MFLEAQARMKQAKNEGARICWTDETYFNHALVPKKAFSKPKQNCFYPLQSNDAWSIMLGASFSAENGHEGIYLKFGHWDSHDYGQLLVSQSRFGVRPCLLVCDGATIHTSFATEKKLKSLGITQVLQPSWTP